MNGDSLFPVLNMLNSKYLILGLQDGKKMPAMNPHAYGNGWFVDEVRYVDDADTELAALHGTDLQRTAVIDRRFHDTLGEAIPTDSTARVTLTAYEANELTYEVESKTGGIVVLSDIYYPSWTCTIDGTAAPIARADYVLRAIRVPSGKHTVTMTFKPRSIQTTETIAYTALAILALLLLLLGVRQYVKSKKQ